MPNYIPTNNNHWVQRVKIGIECLVDRRIAWVDNDFPLTHEEVQDVVIHPDTLQLIHTLIIKHNVKNLPKVSRVHFVPPPHENMLRKAELLITCKPDMHLPDYDRDGIGFAPVADFSRLPHERQALFYTWLHNAVTERRHRDLINHFVGDFLKVCAPSLWHIMARWPTLSLGFDSDTKQRARDGGPRYPKQYDWPRADAVAYQWHSDNLKFTDFIDALLLDASMLPRSMDESERGKRPGPWVRAVVTQWQKRDNERF